MENKKYYKRQISEIDTQEQEQKMVVRGRAIVYDVPTVLFTVDGQEYKEVIKKGAFSGANLKNAFFKYNHNDENIPLARYKNGSINFYEKEDGVYFDATFSDTTFARDMYTLIKDGIIDKMSFAFTIKQENYEEKDNTFYVEKIDAVYDISAVNVPAYEDTFIYARRQQDVDALRLEKVDALNLQKVDAFKDKIIKMRKTLQEVKEL